MSTMIIFRSAAKTTMSIVAGLLILVSQALAAQVTTINTEHTSGSTFNFTAGITGTDDFTALPVNVKKATKRKFVIAQRADTPQKQPTDRFEYEIRLKKEINEWTLGLASGEALGTPLRMATEMSAIVDDGKNMHVLPVVSRGLANNIDALLYMRGIDMAIFNTDVLNHYKKEKPFLNIDRRINYITQLFLSELHILARPEIRSIQDLRGKTVNFGSRGTAASFSGPEIFKRLNIRVSGKFIPQSIAMEEMKRNKDIAAIVLMSGKPISSISQAKWPKGFHLLPVRYTSSLTDYYLPTSFNSKDYPGLVSEGKIVSTIAVPTVLGVYNWKRNSKRYLKVERFIQYMLKRWKKFQEPPFHEKWKTINLNAKLPGWNRFPAMEEQLDLMARLNRANALQKKPKNTQVRDKKLKKAFDRFLRNYARANGLSSFSAEQRDKLFKQFYKFWQETGN